MNEPNSDQKKVAAGKRSRWPRRLLWTIIILLVLAGLVVFVLPSPIARYVVSRQLDSLGISHQGDETIVVDLWNRQAHIGPMELSAGEEEPAKIGMVDVTYSLANIFKGRALIETFTLSGIDI